MAVRGESNFEQCIISSLLKDAVTEGIALHFVAVIDICQDIEEVEVSTKSFHLRGTCGVVELIAIEEQRLRRDLRISHIRADHLTPLLARTLHSCNYRLILRFDIHAIHGEFRDGFRHLNNVRMISLNGSSIGEVDGDN